MNLPEQCSKCMNYKVSESSCTIHDYLVGEGERTNITECPSYLPRSSEDNLKLLANYIDQDSDQLVSQALSKAVDNILTGYSEKFKIMVIGIARRKIKAVLKMVDVIDRLLERIDNDDMDLTASQSIRLLSELNNSINTDLSFIMKLVQPDSTFKDIQMYFDQRTQTVVMPNGSSPTTNKVAEDLLSISSTSRENIRSAFDMILHNLEDMQRAPADPINKVDDLEEE